MLRGTDIAPTWPKPPLNEWNLATPTRTGAPANALSPPHPPSARTNAIGHICSPEYKGEWRCDLHPRCNATEPLACIDSPHLGTVRQVHAPGPRDSSATGGADGVHLDDRRKNRGRRPSTRFVSPTSRSSSVRTSPMMETAGAPQGCPSGPPPPLHSRTFPAAAAQAALFESLCETESHENVLAATGLAMALAIEPWQRTPPRRSAPRYSSNPDKPRAMSTIGRILDENGMTVCRIRMFETHKRKATARGILRSTTRPSGGAEPPPSEVFATQFRRTTRRRVSSIRKARPTGVIAGNVKDLVTHFRSFPPCPLGPCRNEPGTAAANPGQRPVSGASGANGGRANEIDVFQRRVSRRRTSKPRSSYGPPRPGFLDWYAQQVHAVDHGPPPARDNHAIYSNFPEYYFPRGAPSDDARRSAHPSWHFRHLPPSNIRLAMPLTTRSSGRARGPLPLADRTPGPQQTLQRRNPICPTPSRRRSGSGRRSGTGPARDLQGP
jgi:hypothetical protein